MNVASGCRNNVILSPHVYPPSITFAQSATSGQGLYQRLNRSFGMYNHIVSLFFCLPIWFCFVSLLYITLLKCTIYTRRNPLGFILVRESSG